MIKTETLTYLCGEKVVEKLSSSHACTRCYSLAIGKRLCRTTTTSDYEFKAHENGEGLFSFSSSSSAYEDSKIATLVGCSVSKLHWRLTLLQHDLTLQLSYIMAKWTMRCRYCCHMCCVVVVMPFTCMCCTTDGAVCVHATFYL